MIHREKASAAVTVLRLDHGPVSALDVELLEAISAELADVAGSGTALVVTGTGRVFSAGLDLFRLLDGGAGYVERLISALCGAVDALFRFPRPLVAAVNGHAIAGGCIIASTADYRLMAAGGGRIGVPELLVGVAFPAIALAALRFAVGERGVAELVYGGETYLPEEARARGLVDEVVPEEELLDRAIARAEQMAAVPERVFWHTKSSLRGPVLAEMEADGARRDAEMLAIWCSPEATAAIRQYVSRTLRR